MESVGLIVAALWTLMLMIGLPWALSRTTEEAEKQLKAFAGELEDGRVVPGALGGLFKPTIEGRLGGREVCLEAGSLLRYRVRVRHGLGHVVLTRDDLRTRLERIPPRSAQAEEARGALQHLIGRLGIHSLTLTDDGWLVLERPPSSYALRGDSLRQVFEQLLKLAPLYESRAVKLRVLGEASARAWTAGGEALLCPFCRDTVDADAEDLLACPTCLTVHHTECFDEAGGCTVFGCASGASRTRSVRV